jgi:hypothetical protein
MVYKGGINVTAAPPTGAQAGWVYTVTTGGTPNAGFTGLTGTVAAQTQIIFDGANWQTQSPPGIWTRTGTTLSPATAGDVVAVSAGTATAPAIQVGTGTTSKPGIYSPGANQMALAVDGKNRLTITNTEVGVHAEAADPPPQLTLNHTTHGATQISSDGFSLTFRRYDGTSAFIESARIDPAGRLLVGTKTPLVNSTGGGTSVQAPVFAASGNYLFAKNNTTASFIGFDWAAGLLTACNMGNDGTGSIANGVGLAKSATSWSATSDERLKTNLEPIADGLQKVGTLRAVTGRYKTDDEGVSRSFLIAQDVQAVLPEAVSGTTDDDDTLSLRYTEVIPLLVSALKEAKERIETLEAKVAALTPDAGSPEG